MTALIGLALLACSPRRIREVEAPPREAVAAATQEAAPPAPRRPAPEELRAIVRTIEGAVLGGMRTAIAHQGPLYLVEVAVDLANPRDRVAEADLELALPRGARIARLALAVAGVLREAVVLPRRDASRIYDEIVRSVRDPALLERDADDSLRLRVAPIPAQGQSEVVVSYIGLAQRPGGSIAAHSDGRSIARVTLPEPPLAPVPRHLRVLLDTSASVRPRFAEHLTRARELLAALAAGFSGPVTLELVAFDQTHEVVHRGPLAAIPEQVWQRLSARGALGATRGADALRARTRADRVLVITDGEFTEGDGALRTSGEMLTRAGVERLDIVALASPGAAPSPALAQLDRRVRQALPQRGLVVAPMDSLERLVHRLVHEAANNVPLAVPGATWWSPRTIDLGVDEELLLLVRSSAAPAPVVRHRGGDIVLPLAVEEAGGPLFERLWQALVVDAELADAANDATALQALAERTAELGVLTPLTAFLALESDEQAAQYKVRRATAPILTVAGDAVVVRPPAPDEPSPGGHVVGVDGSATADATRREPTKRMEFNKITNDLERRSLLMGQTLPLDDAVEMIEMIGRIVEDGPSDEFDVRAQLDDVFRTLERQLRNNRYAELDKLLAFVQPYRQRALETTGPTRACHFKELAKALRSHDYNARPKGRRALPGVVGSLEPEAPAVLTAKDALLLARAFDHHGRPDDAVRALGSLADLSEPLAAVVALDSHPRGRALAAEILRELAAEGTPAASLYTPRHLFIRRLLARARARDGAFDDAFELLAAPLRFEPMNEREFEDIDWFNYSAMRHDVAADLRLIGARWAATAPRRRAAIKRDVEALASHGFTGALGIEAVHVGAERAQIHVHDSLGSIVERANFVDLGEVNVAQLQLSASKLPGALEIAYGSEGDWVRIDLYDATGPKITFRSELMIVPGPRMSIALPEHLIRRGGCPTPPAARGPAAVRPR